MKTFKLIKRMRELMSNQFWKAKQDYVKYYEELPIDEKTILLESEHGKKIDGNIFYLIRYLATSEDYKDYKIYLASMGRNIRKFTDFLAKHGIENVNIVMLASDEYMRLLASAKYLINDTSFSTYFIKKEGQIYLNTWHGTPLKTLGKSDAGDYHNIGNVQRNFVKSDYLLYPNEYTRDIMIRDYMLENIASSSVVLSGYPRNEIFFDKEAALRVREELEISDKRVYVYMPTYRGSVGKGKTSKSSAYLVYYLYELDKRLGENEVLYVNLHPLATDGVDFCEFKNIKRFPVGYEVYEFLNCADVLITDYSSVFFDFAVTEKKIVLFTYDEEEYLATRGMYMGIDALPFPRVYDLESLICELRGEKKYDESEFLKEFCLYESADASKNLCDAVILGKKDKVKIESIRDNGKENVLIYTGNLAGNGITASLMSLLNTIDLTKRNYILTFRSDVVSRHKETLKNIPEGVSYFAFTSDPAISIRGRVIRKLFRVKKINATQYMNHAKKEVKNEFNEFFGNIRIDSVIQFNGYEDDVIFLFSAFEGKSTIFVHSDMVEEIAKKGNQRWDVLKYAYRNYDNVAVVTPDMIAPTLKISKQRDNIVVVKNAINYKRILDKAELPLEDRSFEKCSVSYEALTEALNSSDTKFISIGRFAPEKAQDRLIRAFAKFNSEEKNSYLFIIGGYSLSGIYNELLKQSEELGLSDRVILIQNMPNPYTILKKCDYFVLGSLYEGFGLVLAEADILGKPVISTDIPGPKTFMEENGGTLVENSDEGIFNGLKMLAEGKVKPMNVDYEKYNDEVRKEFDTLF